MTQDFDRWVGSYLADLPSGFDSQTQMLLGPDNKIMITHPEQPAMVFNETTKQFEKLGG